MITSLRLLEKDPKRHSRHQNRRAADVSPPVSPHVRSGRRANTHRSPMRARLKNRDSKPCFLMAHRWIE